MERLEADVAALAALTRDSAGAGERASAAWLAQRIGPRAAVEPYRYQGSYAGAHALHYAAGLRGGLAALVALVSLELEVSGRLQWARRLLPASEGANVVAHIGGEGPPLVVVAHHDAARTGLIWHPRVVALGAARNLRRRRIDGYHQPVALALLLSAQPYRPLRRLGRMLLALALATAADVARSPAVPGANDNATGVAAALALADDPPPGVDLWVVLPGSEESGMGGFRAFLGAHELDHERALVLCLDTLGSGTPIVLSGEGSLLEHRYADQDLALVPDDVQRWRIGGWTDAILALFAGYRTLSVLSMGPGHFPHYHHPSDVPEHVDFDCVRRCAALARTIAERFSSTTRAP